ncbi:MAG: SOS response-associated peptidase family protein [Betaproteobacteria bacterium]|nr:SOS response-associated peptidase family protein [Betaproteobacteria bacterium]
MCTRYVTPDQAAIERYWQIGRDDGNPWRGQREVFPNSLAPFIRGIRAADERRRELVVGQWGLIPWFAKAAKLTWSTNNARVEEIANKASFKQSWLHGKRCIIPAWSFDEPCWETGRNVWWHFRRADGTPWGLAGLWNAWTDPASGEIIQSYTMLTVNADSHPLFSRMHKPDPKLPPDRQDKRGVIPIELTDVDAWLHGSTEDVQALIRVPPAEAFDAAPDK